MTTLLTDLLALAAALTFAIGASAGAAVLQMLIQ